MSALNWNNRKATKLYELHVNRLVESLNVYSTVYKLLIENRSVNRAGPNAGRASSGRAEQFLNSLAILAGSSIL